MVKTVNDNFSVSQICRSGQCFRMDELEGGKEGAAGLVAYGKYLELSQTGNEICFDCTQEEYDGIWKSYFDMETDYASIIGRIDAKDEYLTAAAAFGSGIRILRQDLWETIISFIISQQNNIKRIKKCIRLLCERYGERRVAKNGCVYYAFPTPEELAKASIEDLYACNLGYRSRYIHETANAVYRRDISLEQLRTPDYEEARKELLRLCGVGAKVADCICLFALHKTEAFPKDTHINKVLASRYPGGFPFDRYADCSGILQQYIFFYDLNRTNFVGSANLE
ncbi:MAG: 8-oxoguanine DNA glycosylase [Lachnospiraceae bacterium]|nr:8-oxoguanine DNA glycosylase [Lachnospiraceae bacterium]